MQAKPLRVLETQEFYRPGNSQPTHGSVRELKRVPERTVILADAAVRKADTLPPELPSHCGRRNSRQPQPTEPGQIELALRKEAASDKTTATRQLSPVRLQPLCRRRQAYGAESCTLSF